MTGIQKNFISKEMILSRSCPEPNTGCWLWEGCLSHGYGTFSIKGKQHRAHRVSYAVYVGPLKQEDVVCHRCDTPACVNPDHLAVGTQQDNLRDMRDKGRARLGKNTKAGGDSHLARLTGEQVDGIRQMIRDGFSHSQVAAKFGTVKANVHNICSRKTWKNRP